MYLCIVSMSVAAVFSFGGVALAFQENSVDPSGAGTTNVTADTPVSTQTNTQIGTHTVPQAGTPPDTQTETEAGAKTGSRSEGVKNPSAGLTLPGALARVRGVLDTLIPFIIGLAVFVILLGIFTYITHAAEEEKRAEAKRFIVWGIVGVFLCSRSGGL